MPLIRKIVQFGNGNGIFLPADWLHCLEHEHGEKPNRVTIEVNDELIIRPVFDKEAEG